MIIVHVKEKKQSKLAQIIAKTLGCTAVPVSVDHFADGETDVPRITHNISGQDVVITHQFCQASPINAQIFDLLVLVRFLNASGARKIIALLPYLPYTRQDQITNQNKNSVLGFLGSFLTQNGVSTVLCTEAHSPHAHNFFTIPFESIGLERFWADYINKYILKKNSQDTCIATPDLGGTQRAKKVADFLGLPLVITEKKRIKTNHAVALSITGQVQDKTVVIIDDILATGRTAINTCNLLRAKGAKRVIGCFAHAVLTPGTGTRLAKSKFDTIYVTNTVLGDTPEMPKKIRTVCVYNFLSSKIKDWILLR